MHLGTQGKERRETELKSENGLETLNQTKICVSKQGSAEVSLFPCFVSWRVTYRCARVCVFSHYHVRLLCFSGIWNKRTVSIWGLGEASSEAPLSALAGTFRQLLPERFFMPVSNMQRQLRAHREQFPANYLVSSPQSHSFPLYWPLSLPSTNSLVPSHFISGTINIKTIT